TAFRARLRSRRSSRRHSCRLRRICRRSSFEPAEIHSGKKRLRPGHNSGRGNETTMDLQLKGRVAVITGPAKGMGAAITLAFAAEGARLALVGRDTAAIEPVAAQAKGAGAGAIIVP